MCGLCSGKSRPVGLQVIGGTAQDEGDGVSELALCTTIDFS